MASLWPVVTIASLITVSILVTALWLQREDAKLLKNELSATKLELLDAQSKRLAEATASKATTTQTGLPMVKPVAEPELETWNGDWTVRNADYKIAKPRYRLECVGHEANRDIKRTQLVKLNPDGSTDVLVDDVNKAGMEGACESVIWILEPKGTSNVYFVIYEPPSVGPAYAFNPATKIFTRAETGFFAGRRLDYVISPDQRYFAQIGMTDESLEAKTIAVYDVVKDSVEQTGKLKTGSSYTNSLFLFNSMASGEPVADLSWAPEVDLKASVYSSKVPLLEKGTCGVEGNPDYKCFERTPVTSVEPMK